ncbi:MAG: phosphoenolpyruvate--protein phosphotransferase [bacterium]
MSKKLRPIRSEIKLTGVPIVPGKAWGKAFIVGRMIGPIEKKPISKDEVGSQIILFNKIRQHAKEIYREYAVQAHDNNDLSVDPSILNIYIYILDDPTFIGQVVEVVSMQLVTLETAIKVVSQNYIKRFEEAQTNYFRERGSDVIEICEKLVSLINGNEKKGKFNESVVMIIPRTFIPSDLLSYDLSMIRGIIALNAGTTSHATILARSYEIPLISGIHNMMQYIHPDCQIYLDASEGSVYLNPTKDRLKTFKAYQVIYESVRMLARKWQGPVFTKDGIKIEVAGNVSLPDDVNHAHQYGADSIGLVRSEYLYYFYDGLPSEEEQRIYFEEIFKKAGDTSIIIRLLDIGADKIPSFSEFPKERNPSLGWRGIRILLKQKELFRDHVSAIIKAAGSHDYSIMIPMVSTLREWRDAKKVIEEVATDLNVPLPRCGMLFEVPLALLELENYLSEIDFLSIGTNDLIQYLLAADRNNPNVNYLYNPLEPAFLHLLKKTIATATKKNKPISICGEMAGSPQYTILLVGLGLRRFSVSSHNIPAIKEIVSHLYYKEAETYVDNLLALPSSEEMDRTLQKIIKNALGPAYSSLEYLFDPRGLSLFCAE